MSVLSAAGLHAVNDSAKCKLRMQRQLRARRLFLSPSSGRVPTNPLDSSASTCTDIMLASPPSGREPLHATSRIAVVGFMPTFFHVLFMAEYIMCATSGL
eukprot:4432646-Amphidinium_carterae.1